MSIQVTKIRKPRQWNQRAGSVLMEIIVSAILLATAFSVVGTTFMANRKLQRLIQQKQIATNELSNAVEQLSGLDRDEFFVQLDELTLSADALALLPDAQFEADVLDDSYGERLMLKLRWNNPMPTTPVMAILWLPVKHQQEPANDTK